MWTLAKPIEVQNTPHHGTECLSCQRRSHGEAAVQRVLSGRCCQIRLGVLCRNLPEKIGDVLTAEQYKEVKELGILVDKDDQVSTLSVCCHKHQTC